MWSCENISRKACVIEGDGSVNIRMRIARGERVSVKQWYYKEKR